ncbi:putative sulfate exporter family transporter [Sedimentibacter sp.]|uniref:YeiH family protein n=1 Tax=Sedimentibacter sp. TaxID=1960295 RepID=UPI0028ABC684|nr:putative sulfate exporter family transporter [Sedimentibacter sp.]
MKRFYAILPGFCLALLIAISSRWIEALLPIPLIGDSVLALFIGMIINQIKKPDELVQKGLKFTSKKVLKFSIILLGASLSIETILNVGRLSLTVMIFTLLTCFGCGHFIGKWLNINWKLSNMISAGTGICGGSAIAAMAPVINAEDKDIAYAMSATFLFDMAMILLFPIMGKLMGLSDIAYGLWAGTAVNDTSSVVAAGYAFSEAAGDFATMVKLTRTLSIIPTVLVFSIINVRVNIKEESKNGIITEKNKVKLSSLFPWFILMFIGMSFVNSIGLIPAGVSISMKSISKFLMVSALAAIGLNTDFQEIKSSGINPMIHGFIISALVVIVAITVEFFIGLV